MGMSTGAIMALLAKGKSNSQSQSGGGSTPAAPSSTDIDNIVSQLGQASAIGKILSIINTPQKTSGSSSAAVGTSGSANANPATALTTSVATPNSQVNANPQPMIINPTINIHRMGSPVDASDAVSNSSAESLVNASSKSTTGSGEGESDEEISGLAGL